MRTLTNIIGYSTDHDISGQLHALSYDDRVEYLLLNREDTHRHRLRVTTDKGTDCAIALDRETNLEDGSVLSLDDDGAIVVRMKQEQWLNFKPRDAAAALELGYFAGNLHWRVRFIDGVLGVAIEGPEKFYLDRLASHVSSGLIEIVANE